MGNVPLGYQSIKGRGGQVKLHFEMDKFTKSSRRFREETERLNNERRKIIVLDSIPAKENRRSPRLKNRLGEQQNTTSSNTVVLSSDDESSCCGDNSGSSSSSSNSRSSCSGSNKNKHLHNNNNVDKDNNDIIDNNNNVNSNIFTHITNENTDCNYGNNLDDDNDDEDIIVIREEDDELVHHMPSNTDTSDVEEEEDDDQNRRKGLITCASKTKQISGRGFRRYEEHVHMSLTLFDATFSQPTPQAPANMLSSSPPPTPGRTIEWSEMYDDEALTATMPPVQDVIELLSSDEVDNMLALMESTAIPPKTARAIHNLTNTEPLPLELVYYIEGIEKNKVSLRKIVDGIEYRIRIKRTGEAIVTLT